jgi:hypothetical protein
MSWLDRLMDVLTRRNAKPVGAGHPPDDTDPPTGGPELTSELESDYGAETPHAMPPPEPPAAEPGGTPPGPA